MYVCAYIENIRTFSDLIYHIYVHVQCCIRPQRLSTSSVWRWVLLLHLWCVLSAPAVYRMPVASAARRFSLQKPSELLNIQVANHFMIYVIHDLLIFIDWILHQRHSLPETIKACQNLSKPLPEIPRFGCIWFIRSFSSWHNCWSGALTDDIRRHIISSHQYRISVISLVVQIGQWGVQAFAWSCVTASANYDCSQLPNFAAAATSTTSQLVVAGKYIQVLSQVTLSLETQVVAPETRHNMTQPQHNHCSHCIVYIIFIHIFAEKMGKWWKRRLSDTQNS